MNSLKNRIALSAALLAPVLLGASAPIPDGATPIVNGHGEWETPIGTVGFEVSVVELPDGTLNGHGLSYLHTEDGNAWFRFEVTEYMFIEGELAVAGLITETFNAPPHFLGSLTVLIIQDNGSSGASADRALSAAGGPPWLTLAQFLSISQLPPPEFWFPVANGNFVIH